MKKIVIIMIALFVISIVGNNVEQVMVPKEAIRFRVIANSNSMEDQDIKIQVRNVIQKELNNLLKNVSSKKEAEEILRNHDFYFKKYLDNVLSKSNQDYKIQYGKNYFPEKVYKGVTYPEGYYESLVVTLGEGKGDNWWCVLFPPLCSLESEEMMEQEEIEYRFLVKDLIDQFFHSNS